MLPSARCEHHLPRHLSHALTTHNISIETKAGIFLGCLPAIKCLWTKFFEVLPFSFTRKSSNFKSWDLMHSPIMPAFDSSSSLHSGDRDSVPLQPLHVERANQLVKGYGAPPDTPGLQETEVKVVSFVWAFALLWPGVFDLCVQDLEHSPFDAVSQPAKAMTTACLSDRRLLTSSLTRAITSDWLRVQKIFVGRSHSPEALSKPSFHSGRIDDPEQY